MIRKTFSWGIYTLNKYVLLRYVISGGTAAVTDLVLLFVLNSLFGIHYLLSAILAYLVAFWVSFLLHKFWTFSSHEERTHKQVVMYFGASLFSLGLNTVLMYVFVDFVHLQVILAQIVVGLLVASISFFISRNVVFKYKPA